MSKQESVLSYLLTKAGKTFKDLANYIGVEESTPYRWSRGTRVPSGRVWENLKEFFFTECGYPDEAFKVMGDLEAFRYYLGDDIDRNSDIIVKLRGEIEGNQTKNALEQYLAKYRDENGNEVELPKKTIKHPVHEYLEGIVGQPINWNAKPIPEYEVDHTVEAPFESSRDGIGIHGGGSFGCATPKSVAIIMSDLQKLIENRFKYFLDTNSVSQFVEVMSQYSNYLNVTNRSW